MAMNQVFDDLNANIEMVLAQLKDESLGKDDGTNFKAAEFWGKACNVVKILSHEATKLCLAFSAPPPPSATECEPLVFGMEKALLACCSVLYSLPKTEGATVRQQLRKALVRIVTALQTLLNTIRKNGFQSSVEQLQQTGSVWEACEAFPNIPRDNRAAVCYVIQQEYQLIRDALQEIQQAFDEMDKEEQVKEDEEEEQWKEEDKASLAPAIGLIKASRACLKKSLPAMESSVQSTSAHMTELDQLAARVALVSPAVDDLVTVLYPPLSTHAVQEHVIVLETKLLNLLEHLKYSHVTGEEDESWVEFLTKAVHHNADKIKSPLPQS